MPVSGLLIGASIASLNLCADEYLLLLARTDEIASVSYLSQDPQESPLWKRARRHHSNRGSLEQVVARRPDIVLTMGGGGRASGLIARRLNIEPIDLRFTSTVADVEANLRTVATALGAPNRARPWIDRLRALQQSSPSKPLDALWISSGGQSFGANSLGVEWLRLAGLRQRVLQGERVSLESLLLRPPAVIVQSSYRRGQISRGRRWLDHPIVRRAPSRRLVTDGRAWTCMGPLLIDETVKLRKALR